MVMDSLVFHIRAANSQSGLRLVYAGIAILVLVPFVLIWFIFPGAIEMLGKTDWSVVWRKIVDKTRLEFVLNLLVPLGMVLGITLYKRNARLFLDDGTLRYTSGLPFLGRWLDWHLDLHAIRANALFFKLAGTPMGTGPMHLFRLTWGEGFNNIKQLRPSAWQLVNQPYPEPIKPKSFLGLVRWSTPENVAILQQQFDQLPLIQALRQRGIAVPKLTGKKQHDGLDLMAYPRFKLAVIGTLTSLVLAFVFFHSMRFQHYFVQPSLTVWVFTGLLVGIAVFYNLSFEQLQVDSHGQVKKSLEFRAAQVFLSCLAALAAGLCAPSVPLALSSLAKPAQEEVFVLHKSPLLLRPTVHPEIPDIEPDQALDYWASLKEGDTLTLPVRRGYAGLWWQFDSSVLSDRLDIFYGAKSRH